ncbi:MAG: ParA family protein [Acidiphilium sp.]|nr:ParA family protein [Acidiphilium sp.]
MPTIVFASSKGGVGKTTSAMMLAFVLARHGVPITVIDADPNHPIGLWAERYPDALPERMKLRTAIGSDVADAIDEADTPFIIVDLEGTKNIEVSVGLGRADLALIPMRGSQFDADEAASVIRLIRRQETIFRRTIPYRVFLSATSPIGDDRSARRLAAQFHDSNIPMLKTSLVERAAFRTPFNIGRSLYDLTARDVRSPETAIANAEAFALEIRDVLKSTANHAQEIAHV